MCRSSPRNSITFALLCARRIGCGVGFEWETGENSILCFRRCRCFFFPPLEVIRRDKLPYPRSLDIRNAFIDGSLRSLLNCRANVSSSERVYPRGRAVSIYPGNFVFPTCGTAELADSSRVQFKLYPPPDPIFLSNMFQILSLSRTISFFIRIFSSLRLKKKIEER